MNDSPATELPPQRGFLAGLRRWWRSLWAPRTIRDHLVAFLGPDYYKLETHDKNYPGYDLASIHRALASLLAECRDKISGFAVAEQPVTRERITELSARLLQLEKRAEAGQVHSSGPAAHRNHDPRHGRNPSRRFLG